MRWRLLAAASLVTAMVGSISAAAESPWYLEGGVGGYFSDPLSSQHSFFHNATPTVTVPGIATLKFSPGVIANIGLGYRITSHIRLEAEAGYFTYTGDTLNPYTTAPGFPALNGQAFTRRSGDRWSRYTGTVNAFYDFAPVAGRFSPYIGGGVGASADHRTNGLYATAAGQTFTTNGGSSTAGIGLLEGGVSIALSPHLAVVPAYRYVHSFAGDAEQAHVAKIALRYSF
jgi:opacity protein-like surface antigen